MKDYSAGRKSKVILRYGLLRRTQAVIRGFQQSSFPTPCVVLDIGTADGLLLRGFMEYYRSNRCIGIGVDISRACLKAAKENVPYVTQADGRRLPFRDDCADIIISTATLKHVRGLDDFLEECHRALKLGGKLVVTDPTPLGIHLGLMLGHFSRKRIIQILNLKDTQKMLTKHGFIITYAERFMLTPVPFVGCNALEGALKRTHFDRLFLTQAICAECSTC